MKHILFSVALAFSILCNHAQAYDSNRLHEIKNQLNIGELEIRTADEAKLPNTDLSAWVIIIKKQRDDQYFKTPFEFYILVTDATGKILTNYKNETKGELVEGKVDTANYRLNGNTRAFGIRLTTKIFSPLVGSSDQRISLFVYENNTLIKVLEGLQVYADQKYDMGGDMSEECKAAWDETKTTLIMLDKKTNGYNNILAKTKHEHYGLHGMDSTGKCKETITRKNSSKILEFNGTIYIVP
jgi:hypothetical protein